VVEGKVVRYSPEPYICVKKFTRRKVSSDGHLGFALNLTVGIGKRLDERLELLEGFG
jgi:hypothetical protein